MATESLQTIGKWALVLLFLGITIYIFYMVLFPRVGGSFWENIKIPIKFGQDKLKPGYNEIPKRIIESIDNISGEINSNTNFDKETNLNRKVKINSLGDYKLAIIKESDTKASFVVYRENKMYADEEIDYVPCVVNAHIAFHAGWIKIGNVYLSQKIHPANKITFVDKNHFTLDDEERNYEFYGLVKIKSEGSETKTGDGESKENICFIRLNNDGYENDKGKNMVIK